MHWRARVIRTDEVNGYGSRHEGPQKVDQLGSCTAGAEANSEEVERVNPFAATLSFRLDALCDLMSIVIISWEVGQVWHVGHVMVILLVWEIVRLGYADVLLLCTTILGGCCLSLSAEHCIWVGGLKSLGCT